MPADRIRMEMATVDSKDRPGWNLRMAQHTLKRQTIHSQQICPKSGCKLVASASPKPASRRKENHKKGLFLRLIIVFTGHPDKCPERGKLLPPGMLFPVKPFFGMIFYLFYMETRL
jgi:hypothetical protein